MRVIDKVGAGFQWAGSMMPGKAFDPFQPFAIIISGELKEVKLFQERAGAKNWNGVDKEWPFDE